ncbi:MAG: inner membrane protein [Candidatus Peregrinibacteria bacterium Gr01-1014_25]|nr:MAG: inner membrane protein [Candidatus Peregrinibacteria bacterium Gr01-1014_25]
MLSHIPVFALSIGVIWYLSGLIVEATDRVARRYRRSGFTTAFLILGFLTSISEISVAANASIEGVPQISAGNLIGASLVILLLIIPLLAVLGRGIPMKLSMTRENMAFLLGTVALPTVIVLDGSVSRSEGLTLVFLYLLLVFSIQSRRPTETTARRTVEEVEEEIVHTRHAHVIDILKIIAGGVLIFLAGHLLVQESLLFAETIGTPPSLVGLLFLSIGTNVPELVIALRCVLGKRTDIAFGDYMGSSAANTLIFGLLPLVNGPFLLTSQQFIPSFAVTVVGLLLFFRFARSGGELSRKEGAILLALFLAFVLSELLGLWTFAV